MNRGYIKLWRKSKDSGLLSNAEAWQLLSWCLLSATHKPRKQTVGKQLVELNPGQVVFGRVSVSKELNTTERKIRTALDYLKRSGFLAVKATSKFSIITILNWDTYQDERPASDQQNGQQDDQQATSCRPASDQLPTTNKNEKNERTREEEKKVSKPAGENRQSYDALIAEYTESVELRQAFGDFLCMRQKIKAPMTNAALKQTFADLDKHSPGNDAGKIAILNQSVQRSWRGVFPLKDDPPARQQGYSPGRSRPTTTEVINANADISRQIMEEMGYVQQYN